MIAERINSDVYDCGGDWYLTRRRHPSGVTYWVALRRNDDELTKAFRTLGQAYNYIAGIRGLHEFVRI